MTRVMFPYILCMSLIAFASGVLNTWRRFAVPAFTPVLLNLSMIAACLWLAPRMDVPVYGLAIGVMAGGVAQLAVQWVALARLGLTPRFSLRVREAWADATVQRILKQMAPATLGVSVAQISLLINTNIATWLTPGSVTWLSFADRLMEFPTALLVALSTVLLPSLSAANARDDHAGYSALLDWGLRLVLLLGLPAAVGMACCQTAGRHAVSLRRVRGAGRGADARGRDVLLGRPYRTAGREDPGPGLLRQAGHPHPGQDRHRRTDRDPVAEPGAGAAAGPRRPGLAIGLGACLNALALLIGLLRRGVYRPAPGWTRFALRLLPALAGLAGLLAYADGRIDWIALQAHAGLRAAWLGGVLAASGVIYFGLLFLFGFRPRDFGRRSAR